MNYSWVSAYARDLYAGCHRDWKEIDDKASSVIAHLGGGAGIVTIGAIALIANNSVSPWVITAVMPSYIAAILAMSAVIFSRQVAAFPVPPGVNCAVDYCQFFDRDGLPRGEAAFLGQWHHTLALMDEVLSQKSQRLKFAMKAYFFAIALLVLPLLVAIGQKLAG